MKAISETYQQIVLYLLISCYVPEIYFSLRLGFLYGRAGSINPEFILCEKEEKGCNTSA